MVVLKNTAPIGAFDSGVGGLSILREVRRLLPAEDLIYLADSAHCPYGVKPLDEIRKRTLDVSSYLIELGAKMIVVACNSACAAGLDQIREVHPRIPVIGVEPAVKPAHERTRNGKIGVLATDMTLNGTKFSTLMEKYGSDIAVYTQPAPGLVELVEAGKVADREAETLLHQYLDPLMQKDVDTIVLGCTHYPFLRPVIQKIVGPEVLVLDTGEAVAKQTARVLEQQGLKNPGTTPGKDTFYTSGDPEEVVKVVRLLWQSDAEIMVKKALV
ncbi:MAG TPA: glutamate racemase [Bacillota bacterium]|nr:glutamate racemase [Bacillota bacterium]